MSDCLISVIIPMYNSAAYIEDCIKSLEAQTFTDYEVIFIDDGSTDNTVELVYQNAQTLPKYTVIKQENKHAGVARNTGIKHAHGEFITCLDSDDCFEPNALEILYQTAIETSADVVRATGFEYDTDGARTDISWSLNKQIVRNHQVFTWKDISQDVFLLSAGNPWGMLVRKDLIDNWKIQFLEIPRTEDIYYTYDCYLKAKKVAILYDALVFHRPSEKSMEQTKVNYPLVPLEARHALLRKVKTEGYYPTTYIGFWLAGFSSYIQMMRLLLKSHSDKEYLKAYYDDIKDVLLEHPDLIFDKTSDLAKRIPYFFTEYRKIVDSRDFESYYSAEITQIHNIETQKQKAEEEKKERFRLKDVRDNEQKILALSERLPKEQETILFSVIIPVYNTGTLLRECLDHLINQSYTNLEIICVDDGSTDDSCEIISEYPQVKLIKQKNSGAGIARNHGFSESHGEYVLFMDGDDWIEYGLFKRMFEIIRKESVPPDFIMYSYNRYDNQTCEFKTYLNFNKDSVPEHFVSNVEKDPDFFINNDFVIPWNKIVRADFIRENKLEYPAFKVSNDRPFYFAALNKAKNILAINDVLINYRVNSKSVTSLSRLKNFECHYLTFKLVEDGYLSRSPEILARFIDITITDMFHFYDNSSRKYKEIIGRQICEYSNSMHFDMVPEIEKYWWFKKIILLKLDFGLPVKEQDMIKVASQGDREILFRLGSMYLYNIYPDDNYENAIGYLMLSADKGHSTAKELLKSLYKEDPNSDMTPSFEICQKLSDKGNRSAQYRLAKMYRDGIATKKDLTKAREYMKKAADQGSKAAKMGLIELYYFGKSEEDQKVAYGMCTQLALEKNKDAQYRLAKMYLNGRGVAPDKSKHRYWLNEAAKNGHQGANKELAAEKKDTDGGQSSMTQKETEAYLESLEDIRNAEAQKSILNYCLGEVDNGNAVVAYYLSKAYKEGRGIEKDLEKSDKYLKMAIERGYVKAENELYDRLWDVGTTESFYELLSLASKNAYNEDPKAMQIIGRAYREGKGVRKDLTKASEWMGKAYALKNYWVSEYINVLWDIHSSESIEEMKKICEVETYNGNVVAVRGLARYSHEEGNDDLAKEYYAKAILLNPGLVLFEYTNLLYHSESTEDINKCFEICKEYSESNNKDALYRLGSLYYHGKGVEKDLQKAKDYLQKAAAAGSNLAVKDLTNLNFEEKKKGFFGRLGFGKK